MESCSIASGQSNYALENLIPAKYFPQSNLFSRIARSNQLLWYVWSNGQMGIVNFYNSTLTQQLGDAQITYSYQYSANNNSIQINVQGWRKPYSDSNYDLWYNKNTVKLSVHINNASFPTSWEAFGADLKIASLGLKPNMPVVVPCYTPHNIFVAVRETDGKVYRVSKTSSTVNTSAYALLTWNY